MRQKRFLSWFLTLCLLLGMFSFPAYAEGNTTTTTISGDGTADKTGTMTITLVIPKKTPAAADLTYTTPSDLTYSGSDKAATVAAASGVTGMGDISVKYYSNADRSTEVTETKNVGTYYVGATVAEGDQYAASTAVLYGDGWTFTITASTPSAPATPTKASATKNSVTLNAVSGCEYSKDGTTYQDGTEFTGLTPGTEYTFYQRVKATANTNASAASSASFTTEADTYAMAITLVIPESIPYTPTPTPTPPTEQFTIPVSGEGDKAESVNVTVQISGTTATVTSADVDKVLEAKDVGNVTVDVSSLNNSVDEVVLPAEMVKKVADAVSEKGNDASGLEVKLPSGTVTFDAKTVAAIAEQSNGKDLKLHLNKVSETTLNSAQQSTVKELNTLVVLDAYVTADGKRISDFNGGTATFSVPVKLGDGQTAAGVTAYFVAENGEKTEIPCAYDGKNATGTVTHFSNYVVAYDTEKAKKAEESAKAVEDTVKDLNALPAAADVKLEDKEAIEKARAAYDALTDEQKAKVPADTLKKLTDAEAALNAAEPVPTPGPATPTDIGYDDLSEAEKKQAEEIASALGVDKDTAAQMLKLADELGVSLDTVKLSGDALAKMNVDSSDPKGTDFGKLTARVTKRTNAALTLQWAKQKKADGYLIYDNKCGKGNKMKLLKTIKKNSTVKWTQKKLKKGSYYKYMVVAYKNVNGQKMPIAASVVIHVPTKGGKTTVAKSVKTTQKVKKKDKAVSSVSVKKGKSVTIKATEVLEEKKLKAKTHRVVKFESSNPKIAKVNAKGKITGKKKGKATVWAYAQNGIFKAIQVTVK